MNTEKKILVIAYDLPPLLQPQAIQIGRLLYHMPPEYKMYVVTSNDMRSKRDNDFYNDIDKKFSEKISITHNLFWAGAGILFRKLPDKYVLWQARALIKIIRKWRDEDFDCILTFACPLSSSIIGLWLKKYFKTKWVAFFSDPWADNPHFNYHGIIKKINSSLEKKVFKTADNLVFASPEMQHAYVNKYSFINNKSTFIEHSYDPFIYKDHKKKRNGKLILRYIGTFYGQRTAQPLLSAIKIILDRKLLNSDDISFEIIGEVARTYKKQYESLLQHFKLHDVIKLNKPVTYLESLSLMQQSDALVLIDAQIDGSVFLPSKLIDYIGADRPIIGITPKNGASARVIKKVGGWLADPSSIEDIENTLQEVFTHYKQGTLEQFKPSASAKKDYLIDNNIQKVLAILQKSNNTAYGHNE
jgi:glycosyltransferase involved in cell wall biosynthesis